MLNENGDFIICNVTNKRCYTSREADTMISLARHSKKRRRNKKQFIPKRSYQCKECGFYHLTSQSYSDMGFVRKKRNRCKIYK